MHIFKSNQRRANIYAPYEAEGVRYPRIPMELLEEIPDPQPPEDYSDETYYRTEQDTAPYVIFTKKSDEQLEALQDSKNLRAARDHLGETDYLFNADRHAQLLADEPQREADLKNSREVARQVIRAYKVKYPKP